MVEFFDKFLYVLNAPRWAKLSASCLDIVESGIEYIIFGSNGNDDMERRTFLIFLANKKLDDVVGGPAYPSSIRISDCTFVKRTRILLWQLVIISYSSSVDRRTEFG